MLLNTRVFYRGMFLTVIAALLCGGCASKSPASLTPKQQVTIAEDTFAVAERAVTIAVQSKAISSDTNTRVIRPIILALRANFDLLDRAVAKTPPDSVWATLMDEVNLNLPIVLKFAKLAPAPPSP